MRIFNLVGCHEGRASAFHLIKPDGEISVSGGTFVEHKLCALQLAPFYFPIGKWKSLNFHERDLFSTSIRQPWHVGRVTTYLFVPRLASFGFGILTFDSAGYRSWSGCGLLAARYI